jgi:hypothetical protein
MRDGELKSMYDIISRESLISNYINPQHLSLPIVFIRSCQTCVHLIVHVWCVVHLSFPNILNV